MLIKKEEPIKYKINQCIAALKAKGVNIVTGVDIAPIDMGLWKYSIKQKKVLDMNVVSLHEWVEFKGKRPRCSALGPAMKTFLSIYSSYFDEADAIVIEQQIAPSSFVSGITASTDNMVIESILLHNFPDKAVLISPRSVFKYIKEAFNITDEKYKYNQKKKLYSDLSKVLIKPEEKVLMRRAEAHKKLTLKRGKTKKRSMVDIADAKFIACYFIEKILETQNMIDWYLKDKTNLGKGFAIENQKLVQQSIIQYTKTPPTKKRKKPPSKKKKLIPVLFVD